VSGATVTRRRRPQAAFTLLEVMIALGILFGALVVLIRMASANVRATHHVKMLVVTTELARAKMLDIEEELLHDGFQEMVETMEGDFEEEGYPKITWEAAIEKVELPSADQMAAEAGADGEKKAGEDESGGYSALEGMIGGGPGSGPMEGVGSQGAAMIMSQFGIIKGVLENAIRKVTLTVHWKEGHDQLSFQVTCYYTDPKAVDAAFGPRQDTQQP
jgi:general secretion pathway protein I